jgi:hypothetical protein
MKRPILALAIASSLLFGTSAVYAKGCLEGAAVGGVAGHVAGKHGVVGAAGGCAIGHHEANKKDKKAQQAAASQPASQ